MATDREFVIEIRVPFTEGGRRLGVTHDRLRVVAETLGGICTATLSKIFRARMEQAQVKIQYIYPRFTVSVDYDQEEVIDLDEVDFVADTGWHRAGDTLVRADRI
jgi:hypothetical protein